MSRKKRTKRQQTTEFRLTDVSGEEHVYDVALHPGSEGQEMATQLMALASEPLLEAASTFAGRDDLSEDDEIAELFAELDTSKVAQHLRETLLSMDQQAFLFELFRYTQRDGENLSNQAVFDDAYRGNYGELWQAIQKVVRANRFLRSLGTLMG